ncbi:unnamed protein product [Closterium sp. Naga37s-1]|nr:unnamed protein product [Closterium sp. Naga37s-1]
MPKTGKIYSVNEGNAMNWDEPTRTFVESCKFPTDGSAPRSLRYIGSMVADVHRTLLYGGIFLYPADKKSPNGKLRVLYEVFPMSFLVEQAGGQAFTGKQRAMDLIPTKIHDSHCFVIAIPDVASFLIPSLPSIAEAVREQSLRKILRQHEMEIQAAIDKNIGWFSHYLSRLRLSSRAGAGRDEDDDDDTSSVSSHSASATDTLATGTSEGDEGGGDAAQGGGAGGMAGGGGENGKGGGEGQGGKQKKGKEQDLSNVGNMDMPMHKVHGVLEPCLPLLPEPDLSHLQLPEPLPDTVVKRLRYYHMDEDAIEIETTLGARQGQLGRTVQLDMFTGKQTMGERAKSFRVQESMEVHCGFAGPNTGFTVAEADQRWLKRCQVAVVTAIFGGGDILVQPIGMTQESLQKVCYVAFWDEVTAAAQAEAGVVPDAGTMRVGLWRIVIVKDLPFVDQRRNGKIPKILSHRLFPRARFSIWVDSKYQFRRDPLGVLDSLLWRQQPRAEFAISEHGARSCIYAEGEAIVRKHKAQPEEVAVQLNQYRTEGLPVNATYNGKKGEGKRVDVVVWKKVGWTVISSTDLALTVSFVCGGIRPTYVLFPFYCAALAEASIIVREHTAATNLFMCLWFNEMVRFTARDQLSFGYTLRRLDLVKPNMFPVCTRRALVNALGHKRKAKPLAHGVS